jgi:hypothetical protein
MIAQNDFGKRTTDVYFGEHGTACWFEVVNETTSSNEQRNIFLKILDYENWLFFLAILLMWIISKLKIKIKPYLEPIEPIPKY